MVLVATRIVEPEIPAAMFSGEIELDPAARTALYSGRRLELSRREYALLNLLTANAGRTVSRQQIVASIWDGSCTPNVVDVYVNYLRRKIDSGREPKLIHTIRGVGYVLKAE